MGAVRAGVVPGNFSWFCWMRLGAPVGWEDWFGLGWVGLVWAGTTTHAEAEGEVDLGTVLARRVLARRRDLHDGEGNEEEAVGEHG